MTPHMYPEVLKEWIFHLLRYERLWEWQVQGKEIKIWVLRYVKFKLPVRHLSKDAEQVVEHEFGVSENGLDQKNEFYDCKHKDSIQMHETGRDQQTE